MKMNIKGHWRDSVTDEVDGWKSTSDGLVRDLEKIWSGKLSAEPRKRKRNNIKRKY